MSGRPRTTDAGNPVDGRRDRQRESGRNHDGNDHERRDADGKRPDPERHEQVVAGGGYDGSYVLRYRQFGRASGGDGHVTPAESAQERSLEESNAAADCQTPDQCRDANTNRNQPGPGAGAGAEPDR